MSALRLDGPPTSLSVRVWDVPTRLVHWLIVVLVAVSWFTAENRWLAAHRLTGYAVLSLVLFRIYWGFRGSTTARFAHFVRGPRAVTRYVRSFFTASAHGPVLGHNPIGGWSVLTLLSLLLLQTGLGLFSVDEYGIESGPLAAHVSFAAGRRLAGLHAVVFNILLLFICMHVAA